MRDQSGSGYDLALANFAAGAGWTEQQVVDLIIHHRRIRSQRPRTALDYFQRTISKAFSSHSAFPARTIGSTANGLGEQTSQPRSDSPIARAILCEQISKALGITVLRIVKISGQEPTYRIELDNAKVAFPSVSKLVGQHTFRMEIASAADLLIPKSKPVVWEQIVKLMLNALTVEDGGDEADLEGSARIYVDRYLADAHFVNAHEEQSYQSLSWPAIYEGRITICSQDLLQYINKTWNQNRAIKEVTAMLSVLGASTTRLKRGKLRDQSRWMLPVNLFPPECSNGGSEESI